MYDTSAIHYRHISVLRIYTIGIKNLVREEILFYFVLFYYNLNDSSSEVLGSKKESWCSAGQWIIDVINTA
jgi:hypothetical protein